MLQTLCVPLVLGSSVGEGFRLGPPFFGVRKLSLRSCGGVSNLDVGFFSLWASLKSTCIGIHNLWLL